MNEGASLSMNLESLKTEYLDRRTAIEAFNHLETPDGLSPRKLAELLRDHASRPIAEREEIDLRDAFDELLTFYGLLEIAAMIGFVDTEADRAFFARVRADLEREGLRAYYEDHYPLLLPTLLRRRLQGASRLKAESDASKDLFYRFLFVSEQMSREDENVDTFLWFLDDGVMDGYSKRHLINVLKNPAETIEHVACAPEARTPVTRALFGFRKFLEFCVEFDALLGECQGDRTIRSAFWHHHGFWFVHAKNLSLDFLVTAIDSLALWPAAISAAPIPGSEAGDSTAPRPTDEERAVLLRESAVIASEWRLRYAEVMARLIIAGYAEPLESYTASLPRG